MKYREPLAPWLDGWLISRHPELVGQSARSEGGTVRPVCAEGLELPGVA